MSCPSRFELARIATGGAAGDSGGGTARHVASHVASCVRCRSARDDLRAARRDLLGDNEERAAKSAARTLLAAARERRGDKRARFLMGVFPLALAAAAVVFWAQPKATTTVRAKGGLVVDLYCKRGDRVFAAEDGADFLAGDRLRFAYTAADPGYLVVFGVDDRGDVFPYYPERDLDGVPLPAGDKALLPGSIELDAHHGWERAFALWSPAPFDDGELRAKIAEALRGVGGDLRRARRLPLDSPQVSYLMRRP